MPRQKLQEEFAHPCEYKRQSELLAAKASAPYRDRFRLSSSGNTREIPHSQVILIGRIAEGMYENIKKVGLPQWSEDDQVLTNESASARPRDPNRPVAGAADTTARGSYGR